MPKLPGGGYQPKDNGTKPPKQFPTTSSSVITIDPSDELNEFMRDFLKKRRAEDAGFAEIDSRLKAQEKRIAELEEELKEYKASEYDRFCIFHIPTNINDLHSDPESLTDDEREDIFRQEYYRRVEDFENAKELLARQKCEAAFKAMFMAVLRGQLNSQQANCDTGAQPPKKRR